jgi:tetratricopeptide (TPR) repeat protein
MNREANVTRVSLGGLDDTDIADLLAAAAGHGLDDEGFGLAHALRRETEGNPFFTTEILRHLGETGRIVQNEAGRWVVAGGLDDLGLPSSVREVVGRRIERLGDETLRLLSLAAVIGRAFDLDLLAGISETDEDSLLDVMDAAVAGAVLIERDDGYRFAHGLIQHTLYEDLSAPRRQRAHQRIAQALETRVDERDPARLAELARHWTAATRTVDADKAIDYSRLAGDAARAVFAPEDAIRWYQQSLDLTERATPSDAHARATLLALLGYAQRDAGIPACRDSLVEAATLARDIGDSDTLVLAALGFPRSDGTEADETAKPILRDALASTPSGASPTRARLLSRLSIAHDAAAEWSDRRALALEALEVARTCGDAAVIVDTINSTRVTLVTPDRVSDAINDLESAARLADDLGDLPLRVDARVGLIGARYLQADGDGADEALAEMQSLTESLGLPAYRYDVGLLSMGRALLAGRVDEVETANEESLQLGLAINAAIPLASYGGYLYMIREHQGRLDELADFFLDAARDNPSLAALRSAVIVMLCAIDRLDEASARLAHEVAAGFEYPYDSNWLISMANLADGAATVGDRQAARMLIDRLEPFADQVLVPSLRASSGAIARPLARAATLLGEYDRAEEWFTIAHDIHERLRTPFWIARTDLDHAELCLTRRADGDLERARELATTAAATAAQYGCAGLAKRADALLAAI